MKTYKNNPEELTAYQKSLIADRIKKEKQQSPPEKDEDDFESEYDESEIIEKVKDIDELEESVQYKDESSEGIQSEKVSPQKKDPLAGGMMAMNLNLYGN